MEMLTVQNHKYLILNAWGEVKQRNAQNPQRAPNHIYTSARNHELRKQEIETTIQRAGAMNVKIQEIDK